MLNRIRDERSRFDDGEDYVNFPHFPVNVEEDTQDIRDIKIPEEVEEMFEEMQRYSDIQTPVA